MVITCILSIQTCNSRWKIRCAKLYVKLLGFTCSFDRQTQFTLNTVNLYVRKCNEVTQTCRLPFPSHVHTNITARRCTWLNCILMYRNSANLNLNSLHMFAHYCTLHCIVFSFCENGFNDMFICGLISDYSAYWFYMQKVRRMRCVPKRLPPLSYIFEQHALWDKCGCFSFTENAAGVGFVYLCAL